MEKEEKRKEYGGIFPTQKSTLTRGEEDRQSLFSRSTGWELGSEVMRRRDIEWDKACSLCMSEDYIRPIPVASLARFLSLMYQGKMKTGKPRGIKINLVKKKGDQQPVAVLISR